MTIRRMIDEIRYNLEAILAGMGVANVKFDVTLNTKSGLGDASSNISFLLAGRLKKSPADIARTISDTYNDICADGLVERSESHVMGYINFFADWPRLSGLILAESNLETFGDPNVGRGATVTVEHTSVNPNKALHIGHVRNIIVGDTVSRILRKAGYDVHVLNYVDDSGLQVADILVGFRHLGFSEEPPPGKKFASYCGDDVYVKTVARYESDVSLEKVRRETLRELEDGESETARFADRITRRVLADQLETCWNLSVYYDCLNFESQIIRSGLWDEMFEKLKKMDIVKLASGGENDGCWVIRGDNGDNRRRRSDMSANADGEDDNASDAGLDGKDVSTVGGCAVGGDDKEPGKVLVRSNGTATYMAKDIPYAAWKLGLVEDPFGYVIYAERQQESNSVLWATTLDGDDVKMNFAGERVITVIDSRQSRLQMMITDLMKRLKSDVDAYVHLGYESVTLSPETAETLGIETRGRKAHMSGRHGLYVDADSVYDMLLKKISNETLKRHPEMPAEEVERISHILAVGTIRYEMIKQDLDKMITFDLTKSLSLDGDTASYIQYAGARASRILENAKEPLLGQKIDSGLLNEASEVDLIKMIGAFELYVSDAAKNLSPKVLARYCHDLAVGFNTFYEKNRVLGLGNAQLEDSRLHLVYSFRSTLEKALNLLGISSPTIM